MIYSSYMTLQSQFTNIKQSNKIFAKLVILNEKNYYIHWYTYIHSTAHLIFSRNSKQTSNGFIYYVIVYSTIKEEEKTFTPRDHVEALKTTFFGVITSKNRVNIFQANTKPLQKYMSVLNFEIGKIFRSIGLERQYISYTYVQSVQ